MRSFEERLAEISRRSEKIFQERKKRRTRILATCIPLVLCVSLYAAFTLPEMLPASFDKGTNTNGSMEDGWAENKTEHVGAAGGTVTVSGKSVSHRVTDAAQVAHIRDLIRQTVGASENHDDAPGAIQENTSTSLTDREENSEIAYDIVLIQADGAMAAYVLQGSVLTDRETGLSYRLTQTALTALKSALGII